MHEQPYCDNNVYAIPRERRVGRLAEREDEREREAGKLREGEL